MANVEPRAVKGRSKRMSSTKNSQVLSNRPKSVFTSQPIGVSKLNANAKPFSARAPQPFVGEGSSIENISDCYPLNIKVPIDGKIWRSISARSQSAYDEGEANRKETRVLSPYEPKIQQPFLHPPNTESRFGSFTVHVLSNGIVEIHTSEGIRIEITVDRSIRVIDVRSKIAVSVSNCAYSSGLIHPNGKIYQYNSQVNIIAYDGFKNNNFVRLGKIWYKGISFTTQERSVIYLIDSAGTRTTMDKFMNLTGDFIKTVFDNDAHIGTDFFSEATRLLENASHSRSDDGTECLVINNFQISINPEGVLNITQSNRRVFIRLNPSKQSVTLTTPIMHCTASLDESSHLFVRRGDRRIHFDGSIFCVRNAGHSAGFDERNLLKIYN